jgi:hypothetical protein
LSIDYFKVRGDETAQREGKGDTGEERIPREEEVGGMV